MQELDIDKLREEAEGIKAQMRNKQSLILDGERPVDEPEEEEKPLPKVEPEPEEEPEEPEEETEEDDFEDEDEDEDEPEEEEEGDDDLENDLKDLDDESDEDEEEEEPKEFSRERLAEEGKRRKAAERDLAEKTAELESLREKLSAVESDLKKAQAQQYDPATHPDFLAKRKKTESAITLQLDGVSHGEALQPKWGSYLQKISALADLEPKDRAGAVANVKLEMAKAMNLVDDDAVALERGIDDDAIDATNKAFSVFSTHTSDYSELHDLYSNLKQKAEQSSLQVGYEEYQSKTEGTRKNIGEVFNMSEEDIEADPNGLPAIVASRVQGNSDEAKRYRQIEKMVTQLLYGPDPLTQESLDRLGSSGTDIKTLHKQREDRVADFRKKYGPYIAQMLFLRDDVSKAIPEFVSKKSKGEKKAEHRRKIRKVSRRKEGDQRKPSVEEEKEVTAEDFRRRMTQALNGELRSS